MPASTINRKNALGARSGSSKRTNKPTVGCPAGGRPGAQAPGIIANSVFALTLKPKVSLQVYENTSKGRSVQTGDDDDYYEMYNQVLSIIQNSIKLVKGGTTTFDPLAAGYDLSWSFSFILKMFTTNVLPKGWSYNIEKTNYDTNHHPQTAEVGYHLVMYKECEFQSFWHCFEIKPVVEYLYKRSRKLHDFFICCIANFCRQTGILKWFNGAFSYCDEYALLDDIENGDWDSMAEKKTAKAEVMAVIKEYKSGEAKWYENFIRNQPEMSADVLKQQLKRFSNKSKLVSWMIAACDFMNEPWTVDNFIYPEEMEESGEGLAFDLQTCIIWNARDRMTWEQQEYLEAESQGCGIHSPILTVRLYETLTDIDLKNAESGLLWPQKLTKLLYHYNDAIKVYE